MTAWSLLCLSNTFILLSTPFCVSPWWIRSAARPAPPRRSVLDIRRGRGSEVLVSVTLRLLLETLPLARRHRPERIQTGTNGTRTLLRQRHLSLIHISEP